MVCLLSSLTYAQQDSCTYASGQPSLTEFKYDLMQLSAVDKQQIPELFIPSQKKLKPRSTNPRIIFRVGWKSPHRSLPERTTMVGNLLQKIFAVRLRIFNRKFE
ncbi:hypothetical protein QNI16_29110 [Cytophagaceae bacterium YF14B1]|uniref:Uncharacterized protein n=1 Tax=Xanthocytophaga flava TaxID=3048013 RepID=A0AAE3UBP0_9BACT|nr:hypothetical protein [Xanthocytophaga flavus]MDJ1484593.1 hypothetical protein [Xanthocytophaga flavus]